MPHLKFDRLPEYLAQGRLMQLATVRNEQPWICTVYFVADSSQRLYWLSYPSRRHSQELEVNPKAAITIAIKADLPVIGVQAEGTVSVVSSHRIVKDVMRLYVAKYGEGSKFYDNFMLGNNKHQLYCFTPARYVVFDEFSTD